MRPATKQAAVHRPTPAGDSWTKELGEACSIAAVETRHMAATDEDAAAVIVVCREKVTRDV